MDRALKKMLKQSIIVRPPGTIDGAGERTYGTQLILMSFISAKNTFIRDSSGERIETQMMIVVEGNGQGIASNWDILLPSGRAPSIASVIPQYDENGRLDHTEIYV